MQGLGNDYIYVNQDEEKIDDYSNLSILLSKRHFAVGADGIITISKSDKADFFMQIYNADGSKGEMCGNGIRCVGKYVYDNKLTDKTHLTVDTLAGIKMVDSNIYRNLILPSEKAFAYKMKLEAIKHQGKKNKLLHKVWRSRSRYP